MRHSDIYLLDMLLAARDAVKFTAGLTYAEFERHQMAQSAVLKAVETIGEAASHVNAATQDKLPQIPWKRIIGMRNRLVHEYFDVNLRIVWETVQQDILLLISQLETRIPPEAE